MPDSTDNDYTEICNNIIARSPNGGGKATLKVERERVEQLAANRRSTPLFELFYNICGKLPPVNNIGYHERNDGNPFPDGWGGIKHAGAIFRGLKRHLWDEHRDSEVYIYVVTPKYRYEYKPDMVCVAKRENAPEGLVFLVYVIFDNDELSTGSIVNWEWVIADSNNPKYPKDFATRYEEEVWGGE